MRSMSNHVGGDGLEIRGLIFTQFELLSLGADFVIPKRAGAYFSYYHYPTGCVYSFCIIGMRYGYLRQRQS